MPVIKTPVISTQDDKFTTIDVIPVSEVVKILTEMFADDCACNFCCNDEWLSFCCDYKEDCIFAENKGNCWEQFLKHYHQKEEILSRNREIAKEWIDNA